MARTVIAGALVAVLAAVVVAIGHTLGIPTFWPLLVAAAVGLAPGRIHVGRVGAFVLGLVLAVVAMALQAGVLPSSTVARASLVVGAIALLTVLALATAGRLPLWSGLAGYAVFAGFYEPLYDANPTHFLSEAPVALTTVLLAAALGTAAAVLARSLGEPQDLAPAEIAPDVAEGGVA